MPTWKRAGPGCPCDCEPDTGVIQTHCCPRKFPISLNANFYYWNGAAIIPPPIPGAFVNSFVINYSPTSPAGPYDTWWGCDTNILHGPNCNEFYTEDDGILSPLDCTGGNCPIRFFMSCVPINVDNPDGPWTFIGQICWPTCTPGNPGPIAGLFPCWPLWVIEPCVGIADEFPWGTNHQIISDPDTGYVVPRPPDLVDAELYTLYAYATQSNADSPPSTCKPISIWFGFYVILHPFNNSFTWFVNVTG